MKFGFVKDPHQMFGFKNNIRQSGWEQDIEQKLVFIKDQLLSRNITTLIFSGDLLDRQHAKDWSFKLYLKNAEILEKIFVKNGIDIYSIQGNHDMFDGHETIEGTVFGKLIADGILKRISIQSPLVFSEENKTLEIFGIDYHFNKENTLAELHAINSRVVPLPNHQLKVAVVMHNNITPQPERVSDFTYDYLSTTFTNIDIFLCGHYHIGFPTICVNNTTFVNPWNMTRVVRDYDVKLDHHEPEMVICDPFADSYEHIKLPIKKFSDAFKPEVVNLLENSNKFQFFEEITTESFEELLKSEKDEEILQGLVQKYLQEYPVEEREKIYKIALSYLNQ